MPASTRRSTAWAVRSSSRRRRSSTAPVRSRAQGLRDPLEAVGAAAGEELLLQAQRVPGPPARALQDRARLRAPGVGAQRGRLLRALGAEGSVDLALGVRLGHHRAVGPVTRDLRMGGCAAELCDRGRVRHRPGPVRATVAGLPRRGQGHPPLPRGDLARDADGCRSRRAPRCLRARLAVGRRREDVEVEAHRHRPDGDHRRVRFGRLPLLLPVGDRVRPGLVRSRGKTSRRATRPSSRTGSETSRRGRRR